MSEPDHGLWQALLQSGEVIATEAEYEHGYSRRLRHDLVRMVSFRLGAEIHAIPIRHVREITRCFSVTAVPRTQAYVRGVGTLRGELLPVLCLASRIGLSPASISRASRVLVVSIDSDAFGLLVDEVIDVVSLEPESLREPPSVFSAAGSVNSDFVFALARREGKLLIVLNLTAVVNPEDFVMAKWRDRQGER